MADPSDVLDQAFYSGQSYLGKPTKLSLGGADPTDPGALAAGGTAPAGGSATGGSGGTSTTTTPGAQPQSGGGSSALLQKIAASLGLTGKAADAFMKEFSSGPGGFQAIGRGEIPG